MKLLISYEIIILKNMSHNFSVCFTYFSFLNIDGTVRPEKKLKINSLPCRVDISKENLYSRTWRKKTESYSKNFTNKEPKAGNPFYTRARIGGGRE